MFLRSLLFFLLLFFVARAVWRLLRGIVQGATSPGAAIGRGARRRRR